MEVNKLREFWQSDPSRVGIHNGLSHSSEKTYLNTSSNSNNNNNNNAANCSVARPLEALEEIKPEVTSEGYGLRLPYGTHLNLDFVKYCENLGQNFKRTSSLRKSKKPSPSAAAAHEQTPLQQVRLAGAQSNESLDSFVSDGQQDSGRNGARAESTLMETRRRLEAFRSFRTKRNKSSGESISGPPVSYNRNGYGSQSGRRGSVSSSSSGSITPNSLGGLLNGNQVTPQHLQIVREQMASALLRLRELEEQVKSIPVLQVKISVLQQEKKHLLEELKLMENKSLSSLTEEEAFNNSHSMKSKSPRNPPSTSSSSGIFSSSPSVQSSKSSQHQTYHSASLVRSTSADATTSLKFPKGTPPPPPKRKYRSVAVGDAIPMDEIVCYSRLDKNAAKSYLDVSERKQYADFSSTVKEFEIDAAFNIFPSPKKQFVDISTSTAQTKLISSSFQTTTVSGVACSTQTHHPGHKSTGCGDFKFYEMYDRACDPIPVKSREFSVMVCPPNMETHEQATSSHDLILHRDAQVGNHKVLASISTWTSPLSCLSKSTSCDGLIQCIDVAVGSNQRKTADASVSTIKVATKNTSVNCHLPITPPIQKADKLTMTLPSTGKWVSYANMSSVSCGNNFGIAKECRTEATNTEKIIQTDQSMQTISLSIEHKSTFADVKTPVCHTFTNTEVTTTSNRETDCSDLTTVLCNISTNTISIEKIDSCTQVDAKRVDVVDSAINTDVLRKVDAYTETENLEKNKDIDTYVDKVQTLLEEQQSLLAERYEVFADEWDKKGAKISRFLNPAFSNSLDKHPTESIACIVSNVSDIDSPQSGCKSPAISASLSIISSQTQEKSSLSSESESDTTEEGPHHSPLRSLPSLDSNVELKSIMRKPGTPIKENKFLRFAEGVKSDDDTTSEEEEDISSDENKKDESSEAEDFEVKDLLVQLGMEIDKDNEKIKVAPPSVGEKREAKKEKLVAEIKEEQFSYSNQFVKKTIVEVETHSIEQIESTDDDANDSAFQPETIVMEENKLFEEPKEVKYIFTNEVLEACDVLEKHLRSSKAVDRTKVALATSVVQREWFRVASQVDSSQNLLDDFVTDLASTSLPVLRKVVNMTDSSGNTVLHYAISHGNILVVDSLLAIDELDVNKSNQAGYTASMLAALCDIKEENESKVFKKLFVKSNVNVHAKEAGQTALMLAVCHGRTETAQLLLECGADINARDEDGSTALMCAVEHGQMEAVKLLLSKPHCDASLADTDGSTALSIAMEAEHREIAILLYAQLNFKPMPKQPRPRTACKSMIPSPVQKPIKS